MTRPPRLLNTAELADARRHAERLIAAIDDGTFDEALRRAAIPPSGDGYPGSTLGDGGSRGSDATSSTERAALGRQRPDHVAEGIGAVSQAVRDATDRMRWAMAGLTSTFDLGESERGRRSTLVECCEPHCDDLVVKAGRCEPCYVYHRRHDGAIVPRSVVQQRQLRRDSTAG